MECFVAAVAVGGAAAAGVRVVEQLGCLLWVVVAGIAGVVVVGLAG